MKRLIFAALLSLSVLLAPHNANAGMPVIQLSDWARMRLDTISFFLFLMLLVAFLIQRLWNHLKKDFSFLPKISFARSFSLTLLVGIGMSIVLSMISGARELFTPGAWQKNGLTYEIAPVVAPNEQLLSLRREKLKSLKIAIWKHADQNNGTIPLNAYSSTITQESFHTLHPSKARYEYRFSAQGLLGEKRPLAWEPDVYKKSRFILYTDGKIELLSGASIDKIK